MPSLKELRNRITSVRSTQKITKAMQMVAAAKLRRAQEAAEAARPYAERMDAVLANLAAGLTGQGDAPVLLTGTGQDNVHLLIVVTAERGLCGGFNANIAKLAREHAVRLIGSTINGFVRLHANGGFDHREPDPEASWLRMTQALDSALTHWPTDEDTAR